MPISWQMMLSTSARRARREAPPPKTESATLETTLKEGALDAGAGGSCCDAPSRPMLAVGNRLESAPVEMPPSLALTTARHGLRVRRARPRAKYGGDRTLTCNCRYYPFSVYS